MFRPPAALLHSGSVFYMTENPLAYVACDGRKIQLRAVQGDDNLSPPRHAPARAFDHWDFVPGCIVDDCLFVGRHATRESMSVWALYEARFQPAPARLSLARSESISSSMSATSAASSGAAS